MAVIIIASILLVVVGGFLLYVDHMIHKENKKLKEELKFTKETIAALYNKPIYAAVTEGQIEKLGQIIASYLHPKEWLN